MSNRKSCLESEIYLSIDYFVKDATNNDLFQRVQRDIEIADLKEIYSKKEMVPRMCTEKEYNSVKASTCRADYIKEQQDISKLWDKPVCYLD
ncbi:hypothetical protein HN903_02525 [archaeon]|jgi:hypothetical protein|nr:hypothetical protein [archaeon]MBT7128607.1 hypothetical protein [archaeon]